MASGLPPPMWASSMRASVKWCKTQRNSAICRLDSYQGTN